MTGGTSTQSAYKAILLAITPFIALFVRKQTRGSLPQYFVVFIENIDSRALCESWIFRFDDFINFGIVGVVMVLIFSGCEIKIMLEL